MGRTNVPGKNHNKHDPKPLINTLRTAVAGAAFLRSDMPDMPFR